MAPITLRDPIHGDIELTAEEIGLVDTPEFQRLRGIKQLGTAYLVYPGATHTRFEHSIGTVHMTDRLLDAANRNADRDPDRCHRVSDEERRILRLAALLHDVTHIPFGHNIEDQTGLLPRHDRPERFELVLGDTALGKTLAQSDVGKEVLDILTGKGEHPPFWRQVLSDTIDADLMDYLRRDAIYTGLELRYDRRVINYFRIDRKQQHLYVDLEKNGMMREDIASELLRLLEIRYHFSERVYYHHAKVAAGALVARMVELALRAGALAASDLQTSTDEALLDRLATLDFEDERTADRLGRFLHRFRSRQLPKRVLVLPWHANRSVQTELLETYFRPGEPAARFEWESAMEAAARSAFGRDMDVIMYCPARTMQLKEARTLVTHPGKGGETCPLDELKDDIPRLRDLADSYPRLWKLYVFTSERDPGTRRRLQGMCLEHLPADCSNALVI